METLEQIALRLSMELQLATELMCGDYEYGINEFSRRLIAELAKQQEPVAITREELFGLVAELKGGSNWLRGKHNAYSYSRAPKIAADVLSALADLNLRDLIGQLRDADKWEREGFGHFKDVQMFENNAPFKAADILDQMLYTTPQPDQTAELEAAVDKLKDALFDVLIQDMGRDKALAKINEVLK